MFLSPGGSRGPGWTSECSKATQQVSAQARALSPGPRPVHSIPSGRAFQLNALGAEKDDAFIFFLKKKTKVTYNLGTAEVSLDFLLIQPGKTLDGVFNIYL